jgi:hypothetical protein
MKDGFLKDIDKQVEKKSIEVNLSVLGPEVGPYTTYTNFINLINE